ncbi:MAG: hypothetical protein ICV75_01590 [Nitrospiraceae bacterium]|nr:hypothetical protein [Nitrospiraceae bacterium]
MHVITEEKLVSEPDQWKGDVQDRIKRDTERPYVGPSAEEIAAAIEWVHLGGD